MSEGGDSSAVPPTAGVVSPAATMSVAASGNSAPALTPTLEAGAGGSAGHSVPPRAGTIPAADAGSGGVSAPTKGEAAAAAGSSGAGNEAGADSAGSGGAGAKLGNPTLWIAGDSTVMTYPAGNTSGYMGVSLEGWGQELGASFDSLVTISNQAIGGRSVAYFMWTVATDSAGTPQCVDDQGTPKFVTDSAGNRRDTPRWARIKDGIKAGDFLLIQFGTNDETHDCPRYVSLADFETDLGIMADFARGKGATPLFVTPVCHRSFSGSTVRNTLLPYANAMKDAAAKQMIEVEDLNARSQEYFMMVGNDYLASNIFDGGTTHFTKAGAVKMAELLAGEIRRNRGPLAAYLK